MGTIEQMITVADELIGQKWCVHRSFIIDEVQRKCGVNLLAIASDKEIATAMIVLEELRKIGVPNSALEDSEL